MSEVPVYAYDGAPPYSLNMFKYGNHVAIGGDVYFSELEYFEVAKQRAEDVDYNYYTCVPQISSLYDFSVFYLHCTLAWKVSRKTLFI